MTHRVTLLITAASLAALTGCSALNQTREPDPTTVRIEALERRIDALERIIANGSLVDLTLQVDEMQRQTAELQGRIEQMEYGQDGSADRQRALYADLDERLQSLENGLQQASMSMRAPAVDGGTVASNLPIPGGSDQDNYQAAFGLLRERKYGEAASAFQAFVNTYPDSQLIDNAQYWLGESYYVTNEFARALVEFESVVEDYPRSRKVPDALLKIGFCQYELQDWPAARVTLSRVRAEFPDSSAASLADQRLARMNDEGR